MISHGHHNLLRDRLRSIQSFTHRIRYEIVVVDNSADSGNLDTIREEFPSATIIHNESPRGYAANCNTAIGISSGRYVLILNDDVIILPRSSSLMQAIIERSGARECVKEGAVVEGLLHGMQDGLPGPIDEMVEFMDEHPLVGACGPMIVGQDGSVQYTCARSFPTILDEIFYHTRLSRIFAQSRLFGGTS